MATIILALENKEPIDEAIYVEVMFDELISGEHPEHRAFIYERGIPQLKEWGIPVTILKANENYKSSFYHVIRRSSCPERVGKYRGFPIPGRCCINRDCKIKPIENYLRSYRKDGIVQYLGIAADEKPRLAKLDRDTQISLLEKYNLTEQDALELCRKHHVLSPIYEFTKRGGCWFCPNCRETELRHVVLEHPELWNEMKLLEKEKNRAFENFNRGETITQIDRRIAGGKHE